MKSKARCVLGLLWRAEVDAQWSMAFSEYGSANQIELRAREGRVASADANGGVRSRSAVAQVCGAGSDQSLAVCSPAASSDIGPGGLDRSLAILRAPVVGQERDI